MKLTSLKLESLNDLYLHELRDLHSAETQLVKALPKMAEAAHNPELKRGFEEHLEQTKGHVRRLEEIFERLDEKASGETCDAMEGLVEEGSAYIDASGDDSVRDAALIAAAQRVEHYEMAGYGTVRALAEQLGHTADANTLQLTLDEEGETNKKLTKLASSRVNRQAATV